MHAHHQHILVVRAVEDHDLALARRLLVDAPEEIVRQLLGGGLAAEPLVHVALDAAELAQHLQDVDGQPDGAGRVGEPALEPADHLLTDVAAKIPQLARGGRRNDAPDGDVAALGIDHLQGGSASVPQLRRADDPLQLDAHRLDRGHPIEREEDQPHELLIPPGPVLERLGDELGGGHDPLDAVPALDDDIGERDFVDGAPVVVDDDDVADTDGVGESDLDAGEHVRQRRLCGKACDDRQHASRGEHRCPDGAELLEGEQCAGDRQHPHDCDADAGDDLRLGADASRVVGLCGIAAFRDDPVLDGPDESGEDVGARDDQGDRESVDERRPPLECGVRAGPSRRDEHPEASAGDDQEQPHRDAETLHEGSQFSISSGQRTEQRCQDQREEGPEDEPDRRVNDERQDIQGHLCGFVIRRHDATLASTRHVEAELSRASGSWPIRHEGRLCGGTASVPACRRRSSRCARTAPHRQASSPPERARPCRRE